MFYKIITPIFIQVTCFLVIFIVLPVGIVSATCPPDCSKTTQNPPPPEPVCLPNPLNPSDDKCGVTTNEPTPQTLIGKVINAVLGIVGSLALLMFIYGGFTWMLAGGNQEAVTKYTNS